MAFPPVFASLRRHPLDAIVDRPRKEAALAVTATWLALTTGLVIGGEVEDLGSIAVAAGSAAAIVFLGFAAASRCRSLPRHAPDRRMRLALLSLAVGMALGLANLVANLAIAELHPAIRAALVERMVTLTPLVGVVAAPLVEEVTFRLFLMGVIAYVVFSFTKRRILSFAIALVGSSLIFALLHLERPLPVDPLLANYYRSALLAKYTLAGVPLGWIFWRWGLPYSILCHVAANAAHLVMQSRFV